MTDSSHTDSSHADSSESESDSRRTDLRRTDSTTSDDLDALVSRLEVIEDQPLAERAPAFVHVHDQLRAALEGADASA